ncbi:MAG: cobalt chelatase, partial [Megasphaera micronuciformis]|nr:cobalt chelatase [Megasphaera micronuciformis]
MKKSMLKRLCAVSLASLALGTFTGLPAQAGYTLNPEVKDATPALKQAAEIGVRKHETPELAKEKNKDAILVLSFGTTYKDSR